MPPTHMLTPLRLKHCRGRSEGQVRLPPCMQGPGMGHCINIRLSTATSLGGQAMPRGAHTKLGPVDVLLFTGQDRGKPLRQLCMPGKGLQG